MALTTQFYLMSLSSPTLPLILDRTALGKGRGFPVSSRRTGKRHATVTLR
jgi:hypothetical protein